MKILVPCKRVPDADQKLTVHTDGKRIISEHLPHLLNPFDAIAVEEALRIRETQDSETEILAVTIGPTECQDELRTALAMGVDRALWIDCPQALDPWNVARILQAVVDREAPSLVLMGKQAVDDDSNQAGQFLAALVDWPQATFASQLDFADGQLQIDREIDTGLETVRIALPAVVTTDLRLNEPRYASLTSILKARKQTIQQLTLADLEMEIEPRVEIRQLETTAATRSCEFVRTAAELVNCLRDQADAVG
ncbi:MAG: electron transfer flavoprotein subunit beta/FixA family protein [Planctomycetota bacterium]|nr:electron transfer flavoprotein subunit beta/FixA family protein [Planctomycetota bacterium]